MLLENTSRYWNVFRATMIAWRDKNRNMRNLASVNRELLTFCRRPTADFDVSTTMIGFVRCCRGCAVECGYDDDPLRRLTSLACSILSILLLVLVVVVVVVLLVPLLFMLAISD